LAINFWIGGTVIIFLISPFYGIIYLLALTRAYWLKFPGWVLYISLFNLSISNALSYLSMIMVFRRRYYELLLYALLNPLYWQLHSIAAYMALCNSYKTLLLGKNSSWY